MAETHFDTWVARRYETLWPELFEPSLVEATVDFLAELAGAGPALELGIGTGRIAVPLHGRGVRVAGIELSTAMVEQLRAQPGAADIPVTVGDFAVTDGRAVHARVPPPQHHHEPDDPRRAGRVLPQRGRPPAARRLLRHRELHPGVATAPARRDVRIITSTPTHVGVEEYDLAAQIAVSRHFWTIDGELRTLASPHRYVWPSELDLMARLAGMVRRERWSDWQRAPFTSESVTHISVWQLATEENADR